MDVDVGAREESAAKGQHSEHTQGETPVPIVAEEPNLEVLGRTTAAPGTDSSSLSFRWRARFIQRGGMPIIMMWMEYGIAVQEKMANTLMSR
jgi:hypothetical protein